MIKKSKYLGVLFIIILSILFTACTDLSILGGSDVPEENLQVHYIDVGQGDAILIQKDGENMLIDGGDNKYGQIVVDYLKNKGVSKLDYLIGTHPHADHIGGLDDVINSFEIANVILPKVSHNTKTFEDVLGAIQKKGLKITSPVVGDTYELGDAQWTILAPNSEEYENLNDYSVVVKLEYKNSSFLFTGDAESQPEGEMLEVHKDTFLESDVMKIGHHGSSSSTTEEFLKVVNPKVAIIQLGEDNSYGHPHKETIEILKSKNIKILRNDINGTIIAISDGEKINFEVEKVSENKEGKSTNTEEQVTNNQEQYIGNKNSKVFHLDSCNQLPDEHNRVYFDSREKAIDQGYRPDQRCKP